MHGGIFGYPGDAAMPEGKLHLLYESVPMAFLIEQAGGKATNGTVRLMDIKPDSIHQRVPTYLGSYDDVTELEEYIKVDAAVAANSEKAASMSS